MKVASRVPAPIAGFCLGFSAVGSPSRALACKSSAAQDVLPGVKCIRSSIPRIVSLPRGPTILRWPGGKWCGRRLTTISSQTAEGPPAPDTDDKNDSQHGSNAPSMQLGWMEQSADALMDDLGACETVSDLLTKLNVHDPDNCHPFTVFFIYNVPFSRALQFEAWVQHTISIQAASFPGYKGTLIYRPESTAGGSGEGFAQYMVDLRYRGAANLLGWIKSRERDLLYSQAQLQQLWLPDTTRLKVLKGNSGSVSSISQDARTEAAHRETTLSYWRVVVFKSICVWLAVMPCNWPGCSLSATLKSVFGLSRLQTHTISVTVAVAVVVYIVVPFLQPYVSHLLVNRSKDHPDNLEAAGQKAEQAGPDGRVDSEPEPELQLFTFMETMEEHRVAAASEADKLLQAANAQAELALLQKPDGSTPAYSTEQDGLITAVLSHSVKPGKFAAFEAACRELAVAAEGFEGFVGHTLMRPPPGEGANSNAYTLIFRFESRDALELWLTSKERNRFAARLYKLVQSPAEVQVHNYSAVDLMLTSYRANSAEEQQPPPPKWKAFCLITCSLYLWSLISAYIIGPTLLGMGWPFPLVVLVTSFFNCGSHSYTTTPYLSRILAPWLQSPTPVPSWIDPNHPLVRWPIQGFTRSELASMITGYLCWMVGRSYHPFKGSAA